MLLARGAAAQDVNYDYDQRANFSAYHTYAWAGGTNPADDLNHARIVTAVDRQLAAKGLTPVDSTEPGPAGGLPGRPPPGSRDQWL
jgi:hypothetical protein